MTDRLAHRGPDGQGVWMDSSGAVALGHRRLAVLDLSASGNQPMASPSGRFVVTYNGEVYNFGELRRSLEPAVHFRGTSDTEVMVAAFEKWGVSGAVERFRGMFAFALWDRERRELHLVRDRLGIKPMHYGWTDSGFFFASELKALSDVPGFRGEVDRESLRLFLRHSCIPAPHTIYRDVFKLPPGSRLVVRNPGAEETCPVPYWSAREVALAGLQNPMQGSDEEFVERLEAELRESVRLRMVADVPLGVFLSGGIDSSCVTALMQAESNRAVKTFSIGFYEEAFNEAPQARAVADHLGTDHTELYVSSHEALAVIPELPQIYDEPFADQSQIPTLLVSRLARQHIKVSLSGDGGDELFAGYNRYSWGRNIWKLANAVPWAVRSWGARGILAISPGSWERVFETVARFLPSGVLPRAPGQQVHKLAGLLPAEDAREFYLRLTSQWDDPGTVVADEGQDSQVPWVRTGLEEFREITLWMMYCDLVGYLPDDILTKLDRAAMAVSLEGRVPLLDHKVVAMAWRLPLHLKVRKGKSKWILRQILYRYVPASLLDRPKAGFSLPLAAWLRGPLRPWVEELLDERRLREEGYLVPGPIRQKWKEHVAGSRNWQGQLWAVLMFQAWLEAASCRR